MRLLLLTDLILVLATLESIRVYISILKDISRV